MLALDCKNLKGLTLRDEKFERDGYSKVRIIIVFFTHNNKMLFNWGQKTGSFVDIWNSSQGFEELKTIQSNSNMIVGYSVKNGLEGIRVHLKKKTAIYFKHIAPTVDGFGTDGIYKMKCVDVSKTLVEEFNKTKKTKK